MYFRSGPMQHFGDGGVEWVCGWLRWGVVQMGCCLKLEDCVGCLGGLLIVCWMSDGCLSWLSAGSSLLRGC
jgi:hypothetical protein